MEEHLVASLQEPGADAADGSGGDEDSAAGANGAESAGADGDDAAGADGAGVVGAGDAELISGAIAEGGAPAAVVVSTAVADLSAMRLASEVCQEVLASRDLDISEDLKTENLLINVGVKMGYKFHFTTKRAKKKVAAAVDFKSARRAEGYFKGCSLKRAVVHDKHEATERAKAHGIQAII